MNTESDRGRRRKHDDLNVIVFTGNLTRDPQLERLANGVAVAKLRVASSATHKRGDTYVPHTNYLLVKVFDKRAEACCEYLRKGSRVLINGEIEYFEWTSADRSRRYGLRVIARSVQFLGEPAGGPFPLTEQQPSGPATHSAPHNGRAAPSTPAVDDFGF
jgi:single-strand DNA-binding protein